jgi:hypothetical protein
MIASKLGSGRRWRLLEHFTLQVGHSFLLHMRKWVCAKINTNALALPQHYKQCFPIYSYYTYMQGIIAQGIQASSTYPNRRLFEMHSSQNLCRHSITVCVWRKIPRHTAHWSSTFKVRIWIVVVLSSDTGCRRWRCSSFASSGCAVGSSSDIPVEVVYLLFARECAKCFFFLFLNLNGFLL